MPNQRSIPRKELLARKHEQALLKRILLILIVCVILIGLFIYYAIPAMVKIADVWDTTRNSSNVNTGAEGIVVPLEPPVFNALPYEATNNPIVSVTGRAQTGLTVHLKQNGKEIKSNVADNSGSFSFSEVKLTEGMNVFSAYTQNSKGKKSIESTKLEVNLDTQPPRVQISSPVEGQSFGSGQQIISVTGKADEATEMYVNGGLAIMKSDGTFEVRVQLQPGENNITMYALDKASNKSVDIIRKVYFNP